MPAHRANLALAKLLVAAAWADGRIEAEEANTLKHFMLATGLDEGEVAEVSALLESPIPASGAESFASAFLEAAGSGEEKARLIVELERMLAADGHVSAEERRFLTSVRDSVDTHTVLDVVVDRVRVLFSGSIRSGEGERSLADVLRTRLTGRVRERLATISREAGADAEQLNRAALFGALLHHVASVDRTLDAGEVGRIAGLLRERFGYGEDEVAAITAVLREQITDDVDVHRLVSEFNRVAGGAERVELLRSLFTVAGADGEISEAEVEEIRRIGDHLWIDRRTFNDVRLRALRD